MRLLINHENTSPVFEGLADETRLMILWLLMGEDELCVCDIMSALKITQSKASRHLRYLYNLGLVTDRRDGLWMIYRLTAAPGSMEEKQLRLLAGMLKERAEAQVLRDRLASWLQTKSGKMKATEGAEAALSV
jgi:ArsR family transcriptional regulator